MTVPVFIGLCNEAISRNSSAGPMLSSLSISFFPGVSSQAATIRITTTPLHPETAAPGATTSPDPGSGGGPGTTSTAPPNSATSNNNGNSNNENRKNSTGVIVGGIIGGLACIVLLGLLVCWRKRHQRPHKGLVSFNGWKETRTERGDNERPVPYELKDVSVHIDQTVRHLPEPNLTPIPTTELSPDEKATFLSTNQLQTSENSSFIFDPSSNIINTSNATRTRSRAFSESSLTQVPSMISQSTLTARQLHIRSEADELRVQLSAIQQAQQTILSRDNNSELQSIKNTLAVMMAHIQRLDRQFESDWARGLTDEAPPEYYVSDARR
ncbi:hypothetical protein VKT23_019290 [Stygiomarasmius scandens]|uniref:Mid2 domain-containing protein n=1 Tax=Marasmiellus scandens TaxID=2682957 RepID=A0ABR1ILX3_9AGAR